MKISHYLFKSTSSVMGLRIGNALLAILAGAILARLLDPESLGYYFLIVAVVAISSNLVRVGQGAAAVRLIAEAEALGRLGRARRVALFTLVGVAVISAIFAFVYVEFLGQWLFTDFFDSPKVQGLTGLIGAWIVIVAIRSQIAFIFRGMHAVRLAAMFNVFIPTSVTLSLLIYLYTRQGASHLSEVVVVSIAGAFFAMMVALVFLQAALKNLNGEGSIRVSEISSISWPLFLIAITNMVMTQGDMILNGKLFDEKDLAIYGVALRLNRIIVLEMLVLGTVMSPLIARLYTQQETVQLERVVRIVSSLAVVPLTLLSLMLVFFGDTIITWIFGKVYADAYPILIILVAGLYVTAIMGPGQQLMVMTGHEREVLPIRVNGGLCAILIAVLTAPYLGIIGIALGFSLATAGISVFTTLRARRLTGVTCYIHSPTYFMNDSNRREITQELGYLIRQLLTGKNGNGPEAADEK